MPRSVTAFLIAFVMAPWVIRKLREIKLGQQIRDDGPEAALGQSGTPTMVAFSSFSPSCCRRCCEPYDQPVRVAGRGGDGGIRCGGICRRLPKFIKRQSGAVGGAEIYRSVSGGLSDRCVLYTLPSYTTKLSVPFFKFSRRIWAGSTSSSSFLSSSAARTPSI